MFYLKLFARLSMKLTCYISVSLNKQLIFSETSTKEESANAVSCFVQAFNDVASTMLKKRKKATAMINMCRTINRNGWRRARV